MKIRNKIIAAIAIMVGAIAITGCTNAERASYNLSKGADHFEVNRRIVMFNGITDKYLLSVEGRCSIKDAEGQLEVTCRLGEDEYKKHILGLSDNVSYFVEQLDATDVSVYHYRVIFKPETILPEVEMQTGKQ
ncbi:beta-sandwich lipoprotein [Glutamicibacter sp. X7]